MSKQNATQVKRERAYRLMIYPVMEARRIGAYSQDEFDREHTEVLKILDECYPLKGKDRT